MIREATPDDLVGIAVLVGSDQGPRPKLIPVLRRVAHSGRGFILVDAARGKTHAFVVVRKLGRNRTSHPGWYIVNLGIHPDHLPEGDGMQRSALEEVRSRGAEVAYCRRSLPGQPWISIGGTGHAPLYQCDLNALTASA